MNNISHRFKPFRCLAEIPNQVGFRLLALDKSQGRAVPLLVAKDGAGNHFLTNLDGTRRSINEFSGWYPLF